MVYIQEIDDNWNRDRVVTSAVKQLKFQPKTKKKRVIDLNQFYESSSASEESAGADEEAEDEEESEGEEEDESEDEDEDEDEEDSYVDGTLTFP